MSDFHKILNLFGRPLKIFLIFHILQGFFLKQLKQKLSWMSFLKLSKKICAKTPVTKTNLSFKIFVNFVRQWIVKSGLTRVKFHNRRVALRDLSELSSCTSERKHASGCFAFQVNFFRNLNIGPTLRQARMSSSSKI